MAGDKTNTDEPSIEDILSSIRDIISDDEEQDESPFPPAAPAKDAVTEKPAEAAPKPAAAPEPEEDDDVLDLAEFAEDSVKEDDDTDPLAGIDFDHPETDDFDMVDHEDESDDGVSDILGDADDVGETAPATAPKPAPSINDDDKDALVNTIAETATVGAMAKLAENISLARTSDGVTLEDIVQELLRPMLKTWLDDNLPDLIERLVSHELERLSQKASRK